MLGLMDRCMSEPTAFLEQQCICWFSRKNAQQDQLNNPKTVMPKRNARPVAKRSTLYVCLRFSVPRIPKKMHRKNKEQKRVAILRFFILWFPGLATGCVKRLACLKCVSEPHMNFEMLGPVPCRPALSMCSDEGDCGFRGLPSRVSRIEGAWVGV